MFKPKLIAIRAVSKVCNRPIFEVKKYVKIIVIADPKKIAVQSTGEICALQATLLPRLVSPSIFADSNIEACRLFSRSFVGITWTHADQSFP